MDLPTNLAINKLASAIFKLQKRIEDQDKLILEMQEDIKDLMSVSRQLP